MNKFNIGDKVKVVGYGSWMMVSKEHISKFPNYPIISEEDGVCFLDTKFDLVGQEGIISGISSCKSSYSLDGIEGKSAWYYEDQLEMVNLNPNYENTKKSL